MYAIRSETKGWYVIFADGQVKWGSSPGITWSCQRPANEILRHLQETQPDFPDDARVVPLKKGESCT